MSSIQWLWHRGVLILRYWLPLFYSISVLFRLQLTIHFRTSLSLFLLFHWAVNQSHLQFWRRKYGKMECFRTCSSSSMIFPENGVDNHGRYFKYFEWLRFFWQFWQPDVRCRRFHHYFWWNYSGISGPYLGHKSSYVSVMLVSLPGRGTQLIALVPPIPSWSIVTEAAWGRRANEVQWLQTKV